MRFSIFSVTVKSNYVDLNDIENPIKPFYSTQEARLVAYGHDERIRFSISTNEVILEDRYRN